MTIAIKGNAQGGVVEANGVAAANITFGTGIPFMKNKLINGEVTRINQRGVANWAAVSNGNYGYDRWKKIDASNMTQIIEAGNFRPNTVHTLSGTGVTTQQITSPASGNWTLPNIPITATNVQVEEGLEATPFEVRPIGFELELCQRYYENSYSTGVAVGAASYLGCPGVVSVTGGVSGAQISVRFIVTKRSIPVFHSYSPINGVIDQIADSLTTNRNASFSNIGTTGAVIANAASTTASATHNAHWVADAEIP